MSAAAAPPAGAAAGAAPVDLRQPAWVERAAARVGSEETSRLIFIFRAIGCAWARRPGGGCSMCGFQAMATGAEVPAEDLIAQLESVLAQPGALEGVGEVDLYNSGSFFSDQEIPPRVREHVLGRLGGAGGVRRVLVEARPEHVTREKVAAARAALGDRVELEVGVGLESADDHVREELVRKGFTRADFEGAVAQIARTGARVLAYLLIKPPGLAERAAVEDAVASARYLFEVAARHQVPARAAFQPVFVAPGTALEQEFLAGRYQPPSLWSVIEVLRRSHPFGESLVGLSDEGLGPRRGPEGCPRCTPALRAGLARYNRTRDLGALEELDCACRPAQA